MHRLAIVLSLLLLTAALPAAANAKVRKGPNGLAFYKPPKPLPAGKHGGADLVAQAERPGCAQGAAPATACCSTARRARRARRSRCRARLTIPKGKAPTGGWPVDLVGARHDGHRRQCAPSRGVPAARQLRQPAAEGLAEGRLRGRPHGLRGPRHAGRAPVPDRRLRGPQRCSTSCAPRASRPALGKRSCRRPLAGRPAGAVGRVAGPQWTRSSSSRGTVAFAPASHLAEQAGADAALTTPGGLSGLAAMILRGVDIARPVGVNVPAQRPGGRAVPADADQVPRRRSTSPSSFGGSPPRT